MDSARGLLSVRISPQSQHLVEKSSHRDFMRLQRVAFCLCLVVGLACARVGDDDTSVGRSLKSAPVAESVFQTRSSLAVPAVEGRHPYVVSLVDGKNSHFCGGVLVSRNLVATAAECLQTFAKPSVHLASIELYAPQEVRQTVGVVYHPNWRGNRWFGKNIALLKLGNITNVQPARFPSWNAEFQPGEFLFGIGWGRQSSTGGFSDFLQVASMPVVSTKLCNKKGLMNGNVIPDYFCAGGAGADMCEGDRGAPLVRPGEKPEDDLLMGLAAFHDGTCGDIGRPSIYLRIGLFGSWISQQIRIHDAL